METILIIEDDKSILLGLEKNLKFEGYTVLTANDGRKGLKLAINNIPDLIILDLILPSLDGFEICKIIRKKKLPSLIIMLTARDQEMDKIMGLELGADDYLTKPFSVRELIARIRAACRRKHYFKPSIQNFSFDSFYIDFTGRIITYENEHIKLSSKEFDLLKFLIENEGKVLTREEILNEVWGTDYFGTARTVDNFITKLRHKLEEVSKKNFMDFIATVRGVGYKFLSNPRAI